MYRSRFFVHYDGGVAAIHGEFSGLDHNGPHLLFH